MVFDFGKPNILIEEESEDKSFARLVCEPLERGYGNTLGNSLRRIMLSTLEGYAVSQIKIDGVLHEFSTIDGVKEDVTEIIMNIKSLAFKNNSDKYEVKHATLNFEGEGIAKASDIVIDPDIEIVNKDLVIAHLSGKYAKLNMDLVIKPGRGYVSSEQNKKDIEYVGYIAVDSIYDPVERVNMKVENTRVGNQTDFDKLTLEVKTNGTLSAKDAVSLAAKVLLEHVNLFVDLSAITKNVKVMKEEVIGQKTGSEDKLDKNINELELSVRSYNCLRRAGITVIHELCNMSYEELSNLRNLGKKSIEEIVQKLSDIGVSLRMDDEN